MTLSEIIEDVACRLYWDDGEEITPEVTKKILRGISRLFDRFSIDGRKLPSICEVEHTITKSDTRLTVGKGKDFNLWGLPQGIYYAAWRHDDKNLRECNGRDGANFGKLCDEALKVRYNDGDFHYNFQCKDEFYGRPTELYYQRGEIIFSSKPCVGDKLVIRAKMPFDVRIGDCVTPKSENKYEFKICPSHLFDEETRCSILEEARDKFDGCHDWKLHTRAKPCGNDCADPVNVVVTAELQDKKSGEIVTVNSELPDGYSSIIYDILVYDLAPVAGVEVTPDMKLNRDAAIKLIHRSNDDPVPLERDYTTPWSRRGHYDDDYYDEHGSINTIRGVCG